MCSDCQYIFLIPAVCQLGMTTSSLSSHLHDCKVPAESVRGAKRKWKDFDPLNRVPCHLKMLIQISFCYDLQYEKFQSFFLSAAVLLFQGYHDIVWKWAAVILPCSRVLQSSHATCTGARECLVGLCSPGPCADTGMAVTSSSAAGLPAQPVFPCLGSPLSFQWPLTCGELRCWRCWPLLGS